MSQEFKVKNKTYQKSDEVKSLAQSVILQKNLELNPARIEYLLVYPNVSKKVAGRCLKLTNENRFLSETDFIVELSGDLWDKLDEDVQKILLWHELKHVGVSTDKKGNVEFKIRDHNIQDFADILALHGVEWLTSLKTQMASVYDLDPDEQSEITL